MVDVAAVSETIAGMLAVGGLKELGEAAGDGLAARPAERVKILFGSDARSADALERARHGELGAVAELASALAWYARRDEAFAAELVTWAAQAGTRGVTQRVQADRNADPAGVRQMLITVAVGVAANLVTGLVIALALLEDQYYRISQDWLVVPWVTVSDVPSPIRWAFAGPLWTEFVGAMVFGGVIIWWQVREKRGKQPNLYLLAVGVGLIGATVLALVGYAAGVK